MPTSDDGVPLVTSGLSEAERAAAFAKNQPVDRAAAFRTGRTPIPPKFIMWMIVVFAVLGLGGAVVEHYYGNIGLPTTATTVYKFTPPPKLTKGQQISASLPALMGLKYIANATAPGFKLTTQSNTPWSLRDAKGKAVVVTFENSTCNDICPVLGAEIKQSEQRLGANASKVIFAIVNTDPKSLLVQRDPPVLSIPRLQTYANVYFLTSKLSNLNKVWTKYGVIIRVGAKANQVLHNDVMYFIGTSGQLEALATPFADESAKGVYSLSAIDIAHFAQGIANTASSLLK